MKTKIFHGTSGANAEKILKEGFNPQLYTWNCSQPDMVYFWELQDFIKNEGIEDYSPEEQIEMICFRTNESGQITSALEKNPLPYSVVFEIEIDEDELIPDDSCENMNGAYCIEQTKLNSMIKSEKVALNIHKFEFYPKLSLLYLSFLYDKSYLNIDLLSSKEYCALKNLQKSSIFADDLLFYPTKII